MIFSPAAITAFFHRYLFHFAVGGGGGVAIGGGGGSRGRGPGYFPGKGNVLHKKYESYLKPILIVTDQEEAHTAVAPTAISSNKWRRVHDRLFEPSTGVLRHFQPWTNESDRWKKLKSSIVDGILAKGDKEWHIEEARGNAHKPEWMKLAHEYQGERLRALEEYQRNKNERQVEQAQQRARLSAATEGMGLAGQPRGQSAPSLPNGLTNQQQDALNQLGGLTHSPNGPGAATTSAAATGSGAVQGSAAASGGSNRGAAGAGTNAQFQAAIQQQQQARTAVGPSHTPPVLNTPRHQHRARNPDQIDVLDQMNKHLSNGIESLSKVIAQTGPSKIEKLRDAISHRQKVIYEKEKQGGFNAQVDRDMLRKLEEKLNDEEMKDLLN